VTEAAREFRVIAHAFVHTRAAFCDREWRDKVAEDLALLIEKTVKEHTAITSNTPLRDALQHNKTMAEHALAFLPGGASARQCRCRELDDGEHRPQPICHACALHAIIRRVQHELKPSEGPERKAL